jgi:hypothetical protein
MEVTEDVRFIDREKIAQAVDAVVKIIEDSGDHALLVWNGVMSHFEAERRRKLQLRRGKQWK